jgi:hypothetical protein
MVKLWNQPTTASLIRQRLRGITVNVTEVVLGQIVTRHGADDYQVGTVRGTVDVAADEIEARIDGRERQAGA